MTRASALASDQVIDITTTGRVLGRILVSLTELTNAPGQEPAAWVAGSPLVEVTFDN